MSGSPIADDIDENNNLIDLSVKKQAKKRSWIWTYFDVINKESAKCSICDREVKYAASSTSNLIYHLKSTHRITKENAAKRSKYSEAYFDEDEDDEDFDLNLDDYDDYEKARLTQSKIKSLNNALVEFIIKTNQPISIVDNPAFREFCHSLNTQFKVPCRQNMRYNLIPAKKDEVKAVIAHELKYAYFVSITSDNWQSNSQNDYLSLTCHYVDNRFNLQNKVLSLRYMTESKTADYLFESLNSILKEWNIEQKLLATTTDSGANIYAAVNKFPNKVIKLPCAGHRLNLCVNDCLKIKKIKKITLDKRVNKQIETSNIYKVKDFDDDGNLRLQEVSEEECEIIEAENAVKEKFEKIFSQCRHLVGSLKHSGELKRLLKSIQIEMNYLTKVQLVQDIHIRWNSSYDMLDSISINKSALQTMELNPKTTQTFKSNIPNQSNFDMIEDFCNIFWPLKDLTEVFSGSKYTTISFLYPCIHALVNGSLASTYVKCPESKTLIEILVKSISGRFKYVLNGDLFKAATFLDYNFKFFSFLKNEVEQKQHIKDACDYIKAFYKTHEAVFKQIFATKQSKSNKSSKSNENNKSKTATQTPTSQIVNASNSSLNYTPITPISDGSNNRQIPNSLISTPILANATNSTEAINNRVRNKEKRFLDSLKEPQSKSNTETVQLSELDFELEEYKKQKFGVENDDDHEVNELGPLYFYKLNHKRYPILSSIAQAIFCLVATSVPSESLFSIVGIIQTALRNRMAPDILEDITIIKENS